MFRNKAALHHSFVYWYSIVAFWLALLEVCVELGRKREERYRMRLLKMNQYVIVGKEARSMGTVLRS